MIPQRTRATSFILWALPLVACGPEPFDQTPSPSLPWATLSPAQITPTPEPTATPPTPSPTPEPLAAYDGCDGLDNDGDGLIDEDTEPHTFPDEDGDGFGDTDRGRCSPEGDALWIPVRGDCDDADPAIHAGAEDTPADGLDSDCGGSDSPDPHLGLETSPLGNIQGALAQGLPGQTIWVGPGQWPLNDVEVAHISPALKSTHLKEVTTLDARSMGRLFHIVQGGSIEIDGFQMTGGLTSEPYGGGILLEGGKLTLRGSAIFGNGFSGEPACPYREAGWDQPQYGGAIALLGGSLFTRDVLISGHSVLGYGGGIYAQQANLWLIGGALEGNQFTGCRVGSGGGIQVDDSILRIQGTRFQGNGSTPTLYDDQDNSWFGGAIALSKATLAARDGIFEGNSTLGPVGRFSTGQDTPTFTFQGGAIYGEQSTLSCEGCRFEGNLASSGGDIALDASTALLSNGTITGSEARGHTLAYGSLCITDFPEQGQGGSILATEGSEVEVEDTQFTGITSTWTGGTARVERGAALTLRRSTISGSTSGDGGAFDINEAALTLEDVTLKSALANDKGPRYDFPEGQGGGIALKGGQLHLSKVSISDVHADGPGGAIYAERGRSEDGEAPKIQGEGLLIAGTHAALGGAIYARGSDVNLSHITIAETLSEEGAAIDTTGPTSLSHAILAYNLPGHLLIPDTSTLTRVNLYNPSTWAPSADDAPDDDGNDGDDGDALLHLNPGFAYLRPDRQNEGDDYHLGPASPLRDAGSPDILEPDGSPSDLGAYSGPAADIEYQQDGDGDGLPDGWELRFGHDPTTIDAAIDLDSDGLSALAEYNAGLSPIRGDDDKDGHLDGAEHSAGSDPQDWYAQPGVEGAITASLGEDFPDLEAALAALVHEGTIEINGEQSVGEAQLWGGSGRLHPQDDTLGATLIFGEGERVRILGGALSISGIDLTQRGEGDEDIKEGVIHASHAQLTLKDLDINARGGPALDAFESTLDLKGVRISGANGGEGKGGALRAQACDTVIRDSQFVGNIAHQGAGVYAEGGSLDISSSLFSENEASFYGFGTCNCWDPLPAGGGGLGMKGVTATLNHVAFIGNTANLGAAISVEGGALEANHILVANNWTTSNRIDDYTTCGAKAGGEGAGFYAQNALLTLSHVALTGNRGQEGSGLWLEGGELQSKGNVLAYNEAPQVYLKGDDASCPLQSSALYPPEQDGALCQPSTLDESNITIDPAFLAYNDDGLPTDWHLGQNSSLIDTLGEDVDPDGSFGDMGIFGGMGGAGWDLDGDGLPTYFWPGAYEDAPEGVDPQAFDPGPLLP